MERLDLGVSPVRYRLQFLDVSKAIVSETEVEWWHKTNFFGLAPKDWPPHAATLRVLDPEGRPVLVVSKGESRKPLERY